MISKSIGNDSVWNSYELIYNEDTGATLIGNDAVFMKDAFGL